MCMCLTSNSHLDKFIVLDYWLIVKDFYFILVKWMKGLFSIAALAGLYTIMKK